MTPVPLRPGHFADDAPVRQSRDDFTRLGDWTCRDSSGLSPDWWSWAWSWPPCSSARCSRAWRPPPRSPSGIVVAGVVGLIGVARRPQPVSRSAHDEIAAMMAPPAPVAGARRPTVDRDRSRRDGAAAPKAVIDPEASMPRWRRPSLLEARHSEYTRQAPAYRPPMRFGGDDSADVDVRVVRYAVVPVLDRPGRGRSASARATSRPATRSRSSAPRARSSRSCARTATAAGSIARRSASVAASASRHDARGHEPRRGRRTDRAPHRPRPDLGSTPPRSQSAGRRGASSGGPPRHFARGSRAAGSRSLSQHQQVLVRDVRHEAGRVAVRPQPRPGLVPDQVALGHEPDARRPRREVRAGEHVPAVLVRVAHDQDRVAAGPEDPLRAPASTSVIRSRNAG